MRKRKDAARLCVVTGDVTMDWNMMRCPSGEARLEGFKGIRACWQRGGAALLADVIELVAASLPGKFELRQPQAPLTAIAPGDPDHHHAFAMWKPYPKENGSRVSVWRVDELLGVDDCCDVETSELAGWRGLVDDVPDPALVVLDDAGFDFRRRPELWPLALSSKQYKGPILLKLSDPVAQGPLWERLVPAYADRLVVLVTADDLRASGMQLSRALSWERTAQDAFWELTHNRDISSLSKCAAVIVTFRAAGCLLLVRQPDGSSLCKLIFDPHNIEGSWEAGFEGRIIGYNTCLAAAVTRELLRTSTPDWPAAIKGGLAAMRKLHLEGYQLVKQPGDVDRLVFPLQLVADTVSQPAEAFVVAPIADPVRHLTLPREELELQFGGVQGSQVVPTKEQPPIIAWSETERFRSGHGYWTLLQASCEEISEDPEQPRGSGSPLLDVARGIVLNGLGNRLAGVPTATFGKLTVVDRREIESYRVLASLIRSYCDKPKSPPLNLAVFGPPGSGKSFGIKQLARALAKDKLEEKTFNLSQFNDPEQLLDALHQVRDVSLSGKVPLVFWDEFDTRLNDQPLGWLRYFLSPMQDGSFQEGQITHPIGPAIFVFAGGTCHQMAEFGQNLEGGDEAFRQVKGPDFVSRLRGYVDIMGPNRTHDGGDPYHVIRRAVTLRELLKINAAHLFEQPEGKGELNMDLGVLGAFLEVSKYYHGVRSLEALINMSLLASRRKFERSSLPLESQLNLHVDGTEFLALADSLEIRGEVLEQLARMSHENYREVFQSGARAYPDWAQLGEADKEANRESVRNLTRRLRAVGYVIVPAREGQSPQALPDDDVDRLAELEHIRWMRAKLADGWKFAPVPDKTSKLNEYLRAWCEPVDDWLTHNCPGFIEPCGKDALPQKLKEKSLQLERNLPGLLAELRYHLVKLPSEAHK